MLEPIRRYIITKPDPSFPTGQEYLTSDFMGVSYTQKIIYNPYYVKMAIDADVYDILFNELNEHKAIEAIYVMESSTPRVKKLEVYFTPFYDPMQTYDDIIKTLDNTLKFAKEWDQTLDFVDDLFQKPKSSDSGIK